MSPTHTHTGRQAGRQTERERAQDVPVCVDRAAAAAAATLCTHCPLLASSPPPPQFACSLCSVFRTAPPPPPLLLLPFSASTVAHFALFEPHEQIAIDREFFSCCLGCSYVAMIPCHTHTQPLIHANTYTKVLECVSLTLRLD